MAGHYAGWQAAPHHLVTTCNDCHTPASPIAKYVVKALNGYHHSMAFTLGGFPDVVRARPESSGDDTDHNSRKHTAAGESRC